MNGKEFAGTVVIAGANGWDGIRMADRQLAEALSAICPVLYVDPPYSPATHWHKGRRSPGDWLPRLDVLRPGLAVLRPAALPGLARAGVSAVNARLMANQVRRAIRRLGGTLHAVIDSSPLMPIGRACASPIVLYWAQDDYAGGAGLLALPAERLARGEAKLLRTADLVVAANPLVRDSAVKAGRDASLIPFGCDASMFATAATVTPAPGVTLEAPIAGFMGQLGDRIDLTMMRAVAERGVSMLLVGPVHPRTDPAVMRDLLDRPNVQWVGGKEFEELPAWLAHVHVGLLPYNHSPFNESSFPLKTLEYLSAGIPVVAADLPAIRWLDTPHITIADRAEEFADAVEAALRVERTPEADQARRAFAGRHTWEQRARAFADLLRLPGAAEADRSPAADQRPTIEPRA